MNTRRLPVRFEASTLRRVALSAAAFAAYFGLIPLGFKAFPAFGGSLLFLGILLSAVIAALFLAAMGLGSALELGLARRDKAPADPAALRRGQIACGGLLALAICVLLLRLLPNALPSGSDRLRFEAAVWQARSATDAQAGEPSPRQAMLADLLPRLKGKRRAELETLLGPSLQTDYFRANGRDLIYPTGPQRDAVFGLDSEWLLIWLDEQGRYQRHAIATD